MYGYVFKAMLEDGTPAYYVGKSEDFKLENRISEHGLGNAKKLVCVVRNGTTFENTILTEFDKYLLPNPSGRKSKGYMLRHTDVTNLWVWLLEERKAVPEFKYIHDLPEIKPSEWFTEGSFLRPAKIGLLVDALTDDERLEEARANWEGRTESYITRPEIAELIRIVLGDDFCDAFSESYFNDTVIKARWYYTKYTDGLLRANPWYPKMYINPDTDERLGAVKRLYREVRAGIVKEFILYLKYDHLSNAYFEKYVRPLIAAGPDGKPRGLYYFTRRRFGLLSHEEVKRARRRPTLDDRKDPYVPPADHKGNATSGHCFIYMGPDVELFGSTFEGFDGGLCCLPVTFKKPKDISIGFAA